ncbi:MAG TPA: YcnI family protein [Mycobacteriales bacterium]
MSRLVRRLVVGGGMAALLVGVAAAPAFAHVTVNSTNAKQGGFGTLAIRVPTESDTASTTGVKVQFPTDAPIANASVKPLPGWTYKVTTTKPATPIKNSSGEEITEVVSVVEWTADSTASAIKPGEYQEFELSVGPLPKVDSLQFKAIQTYSDGNEVAWIEEKKDGADSPQHPAPILKLLPAATTDGAAPAATANTDVSTTTDTTPAAAESDAPSKGSVTAAMVIGLVGVVIGVAGLGVGLTARRSAAGAAGKETAVS